MILSRYIDIIPNYIDIIHDIIRVCRGGDTRGGRREAGREGERLRTR